MARKKNEYFVANASYVHLPDEFWRDRFNDLQVMLERQVLNDMEPYMPRVTGNFIERTMAESAKLLGTGKVCVGDGPQGHFLHTGLLMVDPVTLSPFARPGIKKIYTSTPLNYQRIGAVSHWSLVAAEDHIGEWTEMMAKEITKDA